MVAQWHSVQIETMIMSWVPTWDLYYPAQHVDNVWNSGGRSHGVSSYYVLFVYPVIIDEAKTRNKYI